MVSVSHSEPLSFGDFSLALKIVQSLEIVQCPKCIVSVFTTRAWQGAASVDLDVVGFTALLSNAFFILENLSFIWYAVSVEKVWCFLSEMAGSFLS